ncbi:tetratricopeptide repeat protein [Stratiformator vulcanicus]|uniref:DNA polymerase III subunit epsilon n=1 Tax=Stratiformator vulcanicus TaxID=2527980 RepID=A0A517R5M0_9PLAN|nr:tetratricopeptide repeat protein [Stratiformator vulcanicus]QDT39196.1 DNA polymerase III subunit epsilon [Stratiformator vulcanicus]
MSIETTTETPTEDTERLDVPNAPSCDEEFLSGERVTFTGVLASMTHSDASDLVEQHGGIATRHLSRQTTILVVGEEGWPLEDDGSPAVKFQMTQQWNQSGASIRVLRESEWLAALGLTERSHDVHRVYTPAQLSEMLGLSVALIRRWERIGLVQPVRRVHRLPYFDFHELTRLRRLNELLNSGVGRDELESSLRSLASCFPDVGRILDQVDLLAENSRLVYRDRGGLVESVSRQRLLDFDPSGSSDDSEQEGADEASAETIMFVPPDSAGGTNDPISSQQANRTAQDWFENGTALLEQDDVGGAIESLRLALMADRSRPEFHFSLADALYRHGLAEAALERYYATVEIDSEYIEAWTQIGCLHVETEHFEAALSAFRIAISIHPDYPDAQLHLAETLLAAGDIAKARRHWEQYLTLDTRGPWADLARQRLAETDSDPDEVDPHEDVSDEALPPR